MNIVSYRGPGRAGGVSSALANLWQARVKMSGRWWHLSNTTFQVADQVSEELRELTSLSREVVDGHYRYCNEFLWPVMHDLPHYARYRQEDHKLYNVANRIFARSIAADGSQENSTPTFVQDYQLALLPELLSRMNLSTLLFWHIPWPRQVDQQHIPQLIQIARGLLGADVIGFHTHEYVQDFLHFIHKHVPGVLVDFENETLTRGFAREALPWTTGLSDFAGRVSHVVTAPLGIEPGFWRSSALIPQLRLKSAEFSWLNSSLPYVLSVDRADYTKGVIERFDAIDRFLEKYPRWRGKVNFVQICERTRIGLEAYDAYWHRCKVEAAKLESKWRLEHWSPLIWTEHFSAAELAAIYRDAAVMLVNPIRDGLNLTAKEFVASQVRVPGMLALSTQAGAWQELGREAYQIDPCDPNQMADAIHSCLTMNPTEISNRITRMKMRLADNTLSDWWRLIAASVAISPNASASHETVINTLRSK